VRSVQCGRPARRRLPGGRRDRRPRDRRAAAGSAVADVAHPADI